MSMYNSLLPIRVFKGDIYTFAVFLIFSAEEKKYLNMRKVLFEIKYI